MDNGYAPGLPPVADESNVNVISNKNPKDLVERSGELLKVDDETGVKKDSNRRPTPMANSEETPEVPARNVPIERSVWLFEARQQVRSLRERLQTSILEARRQRTQQGLQGNSKPAVNSEETLKKPLMRDEELLEGLRQILEEMERAEAAHTPADVGLQMAEPYAASTSVQTQTGLNQPASGSLDNPEKRQTDKSKPLSKVTSEPSKRNHVSRKYRPEQSIEDIRRDVEYIVRILSNRLPGSSRSNVLIDELRQTERDINTILSRIMENMSDERKSAIHRVISNSIDKTEFPEFSEKMSRDEKDLEILNNFMKLVASWDPANSATNQTPAADDSNECPTQIADAEEETGELSEVDSETDLNEDFANAEETPEVPARDVIPDRSDWLFEALQQVRSLRDKLQNSLVEARERARLDLQGNAKPAIKSEETTKEALMRDELLEGLRQIHERIKEMEKAEAAAKREAEAAAKRQAEAPARRRRKAEPCAPAPNLQTQTVSNQPVSDCSDTNENCQTDESKPESKVASEPSKRYFWDKSIPLIRQDVEIIVRILTNRLPDSSKSNTLDEFRQIQNDINVTLSRIESTR